MKIPQSILEEKLQYKPPQPRVFAIGDTHAHYKELMALLDTLKTEASYNPSVDHLVLLGDLVDTGPSTKELIEWCMAYQKQYPNTFHPLKGNHDDMFVDATKYGCKRYQPGVWYTQGGAQTLQSYESTTQKEENGDEITEVIIPEEHVNWLEDLPLFWENDDYFFVHAGVPPVWLSEIREELAKEESDPELVDHLLWIRGDFYNSPFEWEKKIIFAHTPFDSHDTGFWEPYVKETLIGINTMPRDDGKLTAIELPSEQFYFQKKL